jgi:thiol-disulfide isomerase/thioredoxin
VLVIGIVIGVLFLTGVLGGGSNGAASAIQPTPTPTPTPTPAPTIIGTWELTQRTENGEDYPYDAVAQLTFEEGGTGFIYDDGYEDELSWDDSTFTLYGETVYYTFTDDELLFSLYDMSFVFSRISYVPYERQNSSYGDDDGELSYATDFALMDRYGYYYSLSDFYGKPIIINFWATWCGPCQMELPYFNDAYLQYGDQIQFLIVDVSYETESDTISFVDSNGYVFPVFFDYDSQGSLFYNVEYIPLTVVIDADGRIVDTHEGSMSQTELQALIDKLL